MKTSLIALMAAMGLGFSVSAHAANSCAELFHAGSADVLESVSGRAVRVLSSTNEGRTEFFTIDVLKNSSRHGKIGQLKASGEVVGKFPQVVRIASQTGLQQIEIALPQNIFDLRGSEKRFTTYIEATKTEPARIVLTKASFDGEDLKLTISEYKNGRLVSTNVDLGVMRIYRDNVRFKSAYIVRNIPHFSPQGSVAGSQDAIFIHFNAGISLKAAL